MKILGFGKEECFVSYSPVAVSGIHGSEISDYNEN